MYEIILGAVSGDRWDYRAQMVANSPVDQPSGRHTVWCSITPIFQLHRSGAVTEHADSLWFYKRL